MTPHTLSSIKSAERAHLSGDSGCCFFEVGDLSMGSMSAIGQISASGPLLMKANFAFSGDLFTMACRAERP